MKNFFKELLCSSLVKHPYFSARLGHFIGGKYQQNINLNLLDPHQKSADLLFVFGEYRFC